MAAHPLPFLTPEEYLRIERASPIKHEYYDGTMYAMPGVSYEHWLIVNNLVWGLRKSWKTDHAPSAPATCVCASPLAAFMCILTSWWSVGGPASWMRPWTCC